MISRLKTRSDPTSRARIATRTSTSRPCVRTSRTTTLANLESPYVIIISLFSLSSFLFFYFWFIKFVDFWFSIKEKVEIFVFGLLPNEEIYV